MLQTNTSKLTTKLLNNVLTLLHLVSHERNTRNRKYFYYGDKSCVPRLRFWTRPVGSRCTVWLIGDTAPMDSIKICICLVIKVSVILFQCSPMNTSPPIARIIDICATIPTDCSAVDLTRSNTATCPQPLKISRPDSSYTHGSYSTHIHILILGNCATLPSQST